jgi:peptidoglycan/xylan/chitin deacetylase (PgdA/CDA1 family)
MRTRLFLKKTLINLVENSGAEWLRDRIWSARGTLPAVILAFHRVTDEIPEDAITISSGRFRAVIEAIGEYYRPTSLADLIGQLRRGTRWHERTVVVTFDDGYRDNFEIAAPILLEHGIPATFFVTVDMIGTERVLPWEEHLRGRIGWMDWQQVSFLRAKGFEIGSHTLSHCDLGKVQGQSAWREVHDSKRKLEDALGTAVSLFAYPFGGPGNITIENRKLVREAGYGCCCSAYGGLVNARSNLFDLPRIPINNWFATIADLHFELRTLAPWRWVCPH